MKLLRPKLPKNFTALDVETKSTMLNAYVLAFGIAGINMEKFTLEEVTSVELNPNDENAVKLFHECPSTIQWWHNRDPNDPYAPSQAAYDISWGGTMEHKTGIELLHKVLNDLSKKNAIISARGPDFDMRVVEQSFYAYGLDFRLRFSNFDSDRTHERHRNAMGIPAPTPEELLKFKVRRYGILHVAIYDAALEAYNGARQLWLSAIANLEGRDGLIKAMEAFEAGEFDPKPYLDRVDFI